MLNKYSADYGLLFLRVCVGALFVYYGFPKMTGGPKMWSQIGSAMANVHINFAPVFWGFMASLAEFGGGTCLILGFFFRPALAMLIFTMFIAALLHHNNGDEFSKYAIAVVYAVIFICLFIAGPGKFALKITRR